MDEKTYLLSSQNSKYVNLEQQAPEKEEETTRRSACTKICVWVVALLAFGVLFVSLWIVNIPLPVSEFFTVTPRVLSNHSRVVVVGDVHGSLEPFDRLLEKLDLKQDDTLILAGDMVTKGPDSLGVLRRAKEVGALCIRGNHDHTVIRWKELLVRYGEHKIKKRKLPHGLHMKTEHHRIASALSDDLFQYLESCSVILSVPQLSMYVVHAGLNPYLSIDQQKSKDVMNMHSIVDHKPTKKKGVGKPWWHLWNIEQSAHAHPKTVVYGHEASKGLNIREYSVGLDSGCVKGKKLSAMIFPERTLIQVKC
ncbi:Metallo-dependent phosphatase [Basidiobolus meristosporus CBS 931.73]|uniref:Metallo-dependent phosphatase n=1 Tax=Basidiobolus meristosporus CBS 931.73 TaxID=1314790 RepID=A0A1Y1Z6U6_9FUNG|nr:Metallo-dependent phosphatase [Basidiobolus meristosporus CBS 931.73]|eukprot:ORY05854.1 Metallo-dependent phosphatase [Basidiobolus meristosporus CBS 931.73]